MKPVLNRRKFTALSALGLAAVLMPAVARGEEAQWRLVATFEVDRAKWAGEESRRSGNKQWPFDERTKIRFVFEGLPTDVAKSARATLLEDKPGAKDRSRTTSFGSGDVIEVTPPYHKKDTQRNFYVGRVTEETFRHANSFRILAYVQTN